MSSEDSNTLTLLRLRLSNYRRFESFEITFDPHLTVLAASNGCGKTAVLDAVGVALRPFVAEMQKSQFHGFDDTDVRRHSSQGQTIKAFPLQLEADAVVDVHERGHRSWTLRLESEGGRTGRGAASDILNYAEDLRDAIVNDSSTPRPSLPVVAYYGTGRLWSVNSATKNRKEIAKNLAAVSGAYLDCLSSSSNYHQFVTWFERIIREAQDETQTGQKSPHRPIELLKAVRKAADHVLRPVQWHTLGWDHLEEEVIANHNERGRLPVSMLSDGVRNILGIVADLAHRCARLNPQLGADACERTAGIVLIDEIDMHLHPSWQQTVVQSLRDAFPRIQFILSTHSPQVLSTVEAKQIRVIQDDGNVLTPTLQTKGVLSSDVLLDVMNVNPEPELAVTNTLAEYQSNIQLGLHGSEQAQAQRETLLAHYGVDHPVMVDCDRLQRMFSRRDPIAEK
jgi:predicted ATP-binding protein involved in virulence